MTTTTHVPAAPLDGARTRALSVQNWSIRTKILSVVALLAVVAVVLGAQAVTSIRAITAANDHLAEIQRGPTYIRGQIHIKQVVARQMVGNIAGLSTPEAKEEWLAKQADNEAAKRWQS